MKDAIAIHRLLTERGAHHEIVRLPCAIASADELPEALEVSALRCLTVRLYQAFGLPPIEGGFSPAGQAELIAVIIPARMRPRPEWISRVVGAHSVRPASATLINEVTRYAAGLVAPLLLPAQVTLLIEEPLLDLLRGEDVVYLPTGESGTAVGLRAADLFALCGPKPVDLGGIPRDLRS